MGKQKAVTGLKIEPFEAALLTVIEHTYGKLLRRVQLRIGPFLKGLKKCGIYGCHPKEMLLQWQCWETDAAGIKVMALRKHWSA